MRLVAGAAPPRARRWRGWPTWGTHLTGAAFGWLLAGRKIGEGPGPSYEARYYGGFWWIVSGMRP